MGPIRILQLLDREAGFEARRSADMLARLLGEEFLVETQLLGAPRSEWRNILTAVALLRARRGLPAIIHAWGPGAFAVAALAGSSPIVFSPLARSSTRTIDWLRAAMSYRRIEVIAPTATLRRRFVEQGFALDRCHLVRPGVEFSRLRRRNNSTLRAELGLADEDHVILACGESTLAARQDLALWAATILHVADQRHKLLFWGKGPATQRMRNLSAKLGALTCVRFATQHLEREVEFEELAAIADVGLVTADAPVATLPIAVCMASALPLVATTSYTVAELLEDRHSALMIGNDDIRDLARRIMDVRDDAGLRWKITDMARTEAYEFFAGTRFVQQFRTVYRQVAEGKPVEIAPDAPGAGARFHGLSAAGAR